jgi:hypothetical protein
MKSFEKYSNNFEVAHALFYILYASLFFKFIDPAWGRIAPTFSSPFVGFDAHCG